MRKKAARTKLRTTKKALSREEVSTLAGVLRRAFSFINELRGAYPLARHIQYPKIPPLLSESAVINWLTESAPVPELAGCTFHLGGRTEADVTAEDATGKKLRIEVKASGAAGFQNLMEKDVKADFIVWLDFGDFFESSLRTDIGAVVLPSPSQHLPIKRQYFSIADFRGLPGARTMRLELSGRRKIASPMDGGPAEQ